MRLRRAGALGLCLAAAALAQNPVVPPNGVVNSASFVPMQAVAPGSIVAIFGTGLTSTTATASTVPLSTSLADVNVSFAGIQAPLFGVFAAASGSVLTQINAQLPWNVLPAGSTSGTVPIVVTTKGVPSTPTLVEVSAVTPGIYTINSQGFGQAKATNADGTAFVAPAGSIPGVNAQPAHIGDVIVVYATGLGPTNIAVANGDVPRIGLARVTTQLNVLIGGVLGQVQFAGLSPVDVGLNQINVQIMPGTPTGNAVSLQIQIPGVMATTDKVTIAVSP